MKILSAITTEFKTMFMPGRLGRLRFFLYPYFLGLIFFLVITFPLLWIFKKIAIFDMEAVTGIMVLIMSLPGIFLSVWWTIRRLNDIGYSSKWMWIIISLIFLLSVIGIAVDKEALFVFGLTAGILFIVLYLMLLFWPGDASSNIFGTPPPPNSFFTIIILILVLLSWIFSALVDIDQEKNKGELSLISKALTPAEKKSPTH